MHIHLSDMYYLSNIIRYINTIQRLGKITKHVQITYQTTMYNNIIIMLPSLTDVHVQLIDN